MRTINKLGASLFINNSYSGSLVCNVGEESSSQVTRLKHTLIGSEAPDVILIYMGTNDCASGVNIITFISEYRTMIDNLKKLCPNSKIVPITLFHSIFYSDRDRLVFSNEIIDIAKLYQLDYVDLDELDLTNGLADRAHPNNKGMEMFASAVVEKLLERYN